VQEADVRTATVCSKERRLDEDDETRVERQTMNEKREDDWRRFDSIREKKRSEKRKGCDDGDDEIKVMRDNQSKNEGMNEKGEDD